MQPCADVLRIRLACAEAFAQGNAESRLQCEYNGSAREGHIPHGLTVVGYVFCRIFHSAQRHAV